MLVTVAVVLASYSFAMPGVNAPKLAGVPSVSASVLGTVPPTPPNETLAIAPRATLTGVVASSVPSAAVAGQQVGLVDELVRVLARAQRRVHVPLVLAGRRHGHASASIAFGNARTSAGPVVKTVDELSSV